MSLTDRGVALRHRDVGLLVARTPLRGRRVRGLGPGAGRTGRAGYDAVRIDAYPHLVSRDPDQTWTLPPAFEASDWGAPDTCEVTVGPALTEFVGKCAERDVAVALSRGSARTRPAPGEASGRRRTWRRCGSTPLDHLADAGLFDAVAWVDLCNEFPLSVWAPFFNDPDDDRSSLDATRPPAAGG